MKEILSLLLTLCLLTLLCVPALADEECPHTNLDTRQWLNQDESTILPFDEKTHSVTGPVYELVSCDDCGLVISKTKVRVDTQYIEHCFVNGVCEVCGAKSTCKHPATDFYTEMGEDGVVTERTETTHTRKGTVTKVTYCAECREQLSVETFEDSITEQHFFRNGACNVCGYSSSCKHEHTTRTISRSTGTGTRFKIVSYTATTHTALCDREEEIWCDDCGECLSRKNYGYGELTGGHETIDDVCEICGYKMGDPIPTATPEPTPTVKPTDAPTQAPTTAPTEKPTAEPTEKPTSEPTIAPTTAPTQAPTTAPTEKPTAKPGKADVPKTGERSFAPVMAALMLCAAGALLLSRRK